MSFFKLIFLQTYKPDDLGKSRNRNVGSFGVILGWKLVNFVHALESWRTRKARIASDSINLVSEFVFLQTNWLDFFLQSPNLKLFTCVRIFRWKLLVFYAGETWWTRNSRKCYQSWHAKIFELMFCQLFLLCLFHQIVIRYIFIWSGVQHVLLVNYQFELLCQSPNWHWYTFRCFLEGIFSDCVPSIGILMVRKCQRVHLAFLFRRA